MFEVSALAMGSLLFMLGFGLLLLSEAHSLIEIVPGLVISLIGGWGFCRILLAFFESSNVIEQTEEKQNKNI